MVCNDAFKLTQLFISQLHRRVLEILDILQKREGKRATKNALLAACGEAGVRGHVTRLLMAAKLASVLLLLHLV